MIGFDSNGIATATVLGWVAVSAGIAVFGLATLAAGRRCWPALRHLLGCVVFSSLALAPALVGLRAWTAPHEISGTGRVDAAGAVGGSLDGGLGERGSRFAVWKRTNAPGGLVRAWVLGLVGASGFLVTGSSVLARRRRQLPVCTDARALSILKRLRRRLGAPRVDFRLDRRSVVPAHWGVWSPLVVLPVAALDWSDDELERALCHELAHVQRRDASTQVFLALAAAIHWPNPLVWMLRREILLAAEEACDDRVVEIGANPDAYAQQLVSLARSPVHGPSLLGASAIRMATTAGRGLERRVKRILAPRFDRRGLTRWHRGLAIASAMGLAGLAGYAAPEPSPAGPPASPESAPSVAPESPLAIEAQIALQLVIVEGDARTALRSTDPKGAAPRSELMGRMVALEKEGAIRVLSAPRVTTLAGRLATLHSAGSSEASSRSTLQLELLPTVAALDRIAVDLTLSFDPGDGSEARTSREPVLLEPDRTTVVDVSGAAGSPLQVWMSARLQGVNPAQ